MIDAFTSLEKAVKGMNMFIKQEKTKYMPVTKKKHASHSHSLEVGPYKFQVDHSFTYLGSDINCNNPYPTAFPYGNGMVLHFYQQQESSTTKTVHKVINKGLKTYV